MKTATRERPILFSGPMVNAILSGRKTQTRRAVKPQTKFGYLPCGYCRSGWGEADEPNERGVVGCRCSQGAKIRGFADIGDRLWVREKFSISGDRHEPDGHAWLTYSSDGSRVEIDGSEIDMGRLILGKAYPSIFMPRWASRITLEVTDVRVERLNEISEADAIAEGIVLLDPMPPRIKPHVFYFSKLWDRINGKKHPWESNPFVWVVSFKRIEGET